MDRTAKSWIQRYQESSLCNSRVVGCRRPGPSRQTGTKASRNPDGYTSDASARKRIRRQRETRRPLRVALSILQRMMMSHDHSVIRLTADAAQVGRKCPVKRVTFRPGEQVVLCTKTGEAISLEAYRENVAAWKGLCPLCHKAVDIQDGGPEPRRANGKADQPSKQTPVYIPTRQSTWSMPGWFWSAVAASALLIILVAIVFVSSASSKRTISASSTTIPTKSTSVVIATQSAPGLQPSMQESISPETTADPTPIPTHGMPNSAHSDELASVTGVRLDFITHRQGQGGPVEPSWWSWNRIRSPTRATIARRSS